MPERQFAICIAGRDWSEEVRSFDFTHWTTFRTERDGEALRRLAGRRITSMTLTMHRTDETEALVGTVPEDGREEVLLMETSLANGDTPAVVARRFDATTLLPPWDTTVVIGGVAHFVSAWFVERVSSYQLRVPGCAA